MKISMVKTNIGFALIMLMAIVLVCGCVENLNQNTVSRHLEADFQDPPREAVVAIGDCAARPGKERSTSAEHVAANGAFKTYYQGETDNPFKKRLGLPLASGGFVREGFNLWDPSIIKVGETYHLFASCWPSDDFNKWKQSYIVRATSKKLLGPYKYASEVFRARSGDYFDRIGCHNPKVTAHGGKFYLYHIGTPTYQSGVAVSDSVEGPWTRQEKPGIPANNPAMWIHDDGSVYGVGRVKVHNPDYDPDSKKGREHLLYLQAIKADSIFGPYTRLHAEDENALPEGLENEDPCIWHDGSRYHVLVTDWGGHATGHFKAFTYYTSQDGLKYELVSKDPILVRDDPIRFSDGSSYKFSRIERPNVVLDEKGNVIAMLAACLPEKRELGSRIVVFPVCPE